MWTLISPFFPPFVLIRRLLINFHFLPCSSAPLPPLSHAHTHAHTKLHLLPTRHLFLCSTRTFLYYFVFHLLLNCIHIFLPFIYFFPLLFGGVSYLFLFLLHNELSRHFIFFFSSSFLSSTLALSLSLCC